MSRDKDRLFRESIYDNQNISESIGRRKLLNEIHRNRIPWSFGNRQLLKETIRLMSLALVSLARGTRFDEIEHESSEIRPRIISSDEFESLVLTVVTREDVVMFVL